MSSPPLYRIRPVREEDGDQVHELYVYETAHSPTSMLQFVMRSSLTRPNSILCYVFFTVGIALLLSMERNRRWPQAAAISMSFFSALFFVVHRWFLYRASLSLSKNAERYPVAKHFGSVKSSDGSTYLPGKSGFWVAESVDPNGKGGTGKIVGCVGLDANYHEDAQHAQLRRMAVSWTMQRRGVGGRLIETLLQHARDREVKVIELKTNGHSPAAVGLYEKFGWKAYATQGAPGMPWVDLWLVDYRLEL